MSNPQLQRVQDLAADFGCVVRVSNGNNWRITHKSLTLMTIHASKLEKRDVWTKRKLRARYENFGALVEAINQSLSTYQTYLEHEGEPEKEEFGTDSSFLIRQDAITRSDLELVDGELRILLNTPHLSQAVQLSPERSKAFLQRALDLYRELLSREQAEQNPFT